MQDNEVINILQDQFSFSSKTISALKIFNGLIKNRIKNAFTINILKVLNITNKLHF